jgi:hypothetical protein
MVAAANHLATLKALVSTTATKGQDLLLEHALGAASIAQLLRLELIRLERTFDGGLNRPIWTILGQSAFAPEGFTSAELCKVAGVHAGPDSLAWVRCASSTEIYTGMPSPLLRLKRCHACVHGIPVGCSLILPIGTVNSVQTRKGHPLPKFYWSDAQTTRQVGVQIACNQECCCFVVSPQAWAILGPCIYPARLADRAGQRSCHPVGSGWGSLRTVLFPL